MTTREESGRETPGGAEPGSGLAQTPPRSPAMESRLFSGHAKFRADRGREPRGIGPARGVLQRPQRSVPSMFTRNRHSFALLALTVTARAASAQSFLPGDVYIHGLATNAGVVARVDRATGTTT